VDENFDIKQQVIRFINKYKVPLAIVLVFFIWMLFIDEYNWIHMRKQNKKLESLIEEKEYLNKKIHHDREQIKTLQTDTDALERFAREEYLLKKENEEVYVIIEEE
jgi:cell division protein FtsB